MTICKYVCMSVKNVDVTKQRNPVHIKINIRYPFTSFNFENSKPHTPNESTQSTLNAFSFRFTGLHNQHKLREEQNEILNIPKKYCIQQKSAFHLVHSHHIQYHL